MKKKLRLRSLRWRLSVFTALLTLGVLAIFCGVTSVMLYYEQIDVLEDIMPGTAEDELEDEARDVLEDLFVAFAWALPAGMICIGAGSWWLLRRELRSLEHIIAAAENIDARSLGARLPAPSGPAEIIRLTSVLNGMLSRLDQAFQQNLRFAADASHELRTPLTVMRGELEAALQRADREPIPPDMLAALLDQVQRLAGMAEQLLFLSRADAGRTGIVKAPLDISRLLAEVLEDAAILAEPQSIGIETRLTDGLGIEADAAALRRVFLNLLENAIKHNHPCGRVTCTLRPLGATPASGVEIEIGNTGPGIPPGMEETVFHRFVRVDESRSRETGGAGLGLSICREIVTAHGGRLHCDTSRPGWTIMRLVLFGKGVS